MWVRLDRSAGVLMTSVTVTERHEVKTLLLLRLGEGAGTFSWAEEVVVVVFDEGRYLLAKGWVIYCSP